MTTHKGVLTREGDGGTYETFVPTIADWTVTEDGGNLLVFINNHLVWQARLSDLAGLVTANLRQGVAGGEWWAHQDLTQFLLGIEDAVKFNE